VHKFFWILQLILLQKGREIVRC